MQNVPQDILEKAEELYPASLYKDSINVQKMYIHGRMDERDSRAKALNMLRDKLFSINETLSDTRYNDEGWYKQDAKFASFLEDVIFEFDGQSATIDTHEKEPSAWIDKEFVSSNGRCILQHFYDKEQAVNLKAGGIDDEMEALALKEYPTSLSVDLRRERNGFRRGYNFAVQRNSEDAIGFAEWADRYGWRRTHFNTWYNNGWCTTLETMNMAAIPTAKLYEQYKIEKSK